MAIQITVHFRLSCLIRFLRAACKPFAVVPRLRCAVLTYVPVIQTITELLVIVIGCTLTQVATMGML